MQSSTIDAQETDRPWNGLHRLQGHWKGSTQTATLNKSQTWRDAQTLFMIISRSLSSFRCTGNHLNGHGSAGHEKSCNHFHALTAKSVRQVTPAFRQRTSCAKDHLVIEMLRELGEDIWELPGKCF